MILIYKTFLIYKTLLNLVLLFKFGFNNRNLILLFLLLLIIFAKRSKNSLLYKKNMTCGKTIFMKIRQSSINWLFFNTWFNINQFCNLNIHTVLCLKKGQKILVNPISRKHLDLPWTLLFHRLLFQPIKICHVINKINLFNYKI